MIHSVTWCLIWIQAVDTAPKLFINPYSAGNSLYTFANSVDPDQRSTLLYMNNNRNLTQKFI